MIPHDDVHVPEPLLHHDRAKVIFEQLALVPRLIDTGLPPLDGHRLVLDGDPPYRHARLAIALNELRKIESPGMSVLGAQVTAVQHVIVVLHERRRAPGTGKEFELVAARGHRSLDQGDSVAQVVRDGEGGQVLVTLVDIRVALAREVTAVDVGPGQGVPDPSVGAVIRGQQLFCRAAGSFAKVSAAASVSAPPIPRKGWKVFRGSTKTYTLASEVGSEGLNITVSVGVSRTLLPSAVV